VVVNYPPESIVTQLHTRARDENFRHFQLAFRQLSFLHGHVTARSPYRQRPDISSASRARADRRGSAVKGAPVIAENTGKYCESLWQHGRTIFIADAHRDDRKRCIMRADKKLTAVMELESGSRVSGKTLPKNPAVLLV
jgi:hypothetical protein